MKSKQVENWLFNRIPHYYDMGKIKSKIIYDKYTWLFILDDDVVDAYNMGCMHGECYDDRSNHEGIFDDEEKMLEWVQQELNQMMEN